MEYIKLVIIVAIECVLQPLVTECFDPKLEVSSCTQSKLNLTIRDAADGGIVYIPGQSSACRQYTHNGVSEHIFDVSVCAVAWSETFRVVVQRHPLYETGEDKRFPVTCIADTSNIQVGNNPVINVIDKEDEEKITKTIRPSATMSLYRDGTDVNGKVVKLTDQIAMVIQLNEDHSDDFDIKAIDCHGGNIQIIQDGCPVDKIWFPKFTSNAQGKLQATFGVFRPTNLNGGTVSMAFTCTLQVNIGRNLPTICDDNGEVNAKYKRKLQANSGAVDEIIVGNSLLINTEDISTDRISTQSMVQGACVQTGVFIFVMVFIVAYFLFATAFCICVRRKLKSKDRHIKKLRNRMKAKDLYYQQRLTDMDNLMESCDTVYNVRNHRR